MGEITHVMYCFLHGGLLDEFDYSGVDPWAATEAPIFTASAATIRFPQAA